MMGLFEKKAWWILGVVVGLLLGRPAFAQVETDQLFFVGFEAPVGSISSEGQAQTAVYLRWDPLEGELPPDLVSFELLRDGVSSATYPVNATLSDPEIAAIYAAPGNGRRRAETLRWLDEEDPKNPVAPDDLVTALRERVLASPARAAMASRVDFVIAQSRLRAHIDTGLANGTYVYSLRGHFAGGEEVLLGQVSVEVDGTPDVVAAGSDFVQVASARCDAPERFKDHHTVALNWDHPGTSPADRFSAAVSIAGYDLYRTDENVESVPARDLRVEAAALPHDADGRVELPGLVKVNDQPLLIGGSAEKESRYEGFNPEYTQFFESHEELAAAGVQPGDVRGYYLVARDVSGNYGETTSLLVTVPDLRAPVAPWLVRGYPRQVDDVYTLRWPHVNVVNYHTQHVAGRTYCNLETARFDDYLTFVRDELNCEDSYPQRVDLDVEDYLVYRFDDAGRAQRFVDTDGDGFDDVDERPSVVDPGTACDPSLPDPVGATIENYRVAVVPAASAVPEADGRPVVEFVDAAPGLDVGRQFWYRIASRDDKGNVSPLTEPVPGIVVDRTIPDRDSSLGGVTFGGLVCNPVINDAPGTPANTTVDATPQGLADLWQLTCEPNADEVTPVLRIPFEVSEDGVRQAVLSDEECKTFADPNLGCGGRDTQLVVLDRRGHPINGTQFNYPGGIGYCTVLGTRIELPCTLEEAAAGTCGCKITRVTDGEVIPPEEGPVVGSGPGPNCTHVYRLMDERRLLLRSLCPGDPPLILSDLPDLGGELICLAVASYDENAQASMMERLPCFRRPGAPSPPTPVAIDFPPGSGQAVISLLHAERPARGAMVEFQRLGEPDTRETVFVSRPFGPDTDSPQQITVDITPEPAGVDWQEEWCFRGLSIGGALAGDFDTGVSEWSAERCGLRQPASAPAPDALPWPLIPRPEERQDPLDARFMRGLDDIPVVLLSDPIPPGSCVGTVPLCEQDAAPYACIGEPGEPPYPTSSSTCDICSLAAFFAPRPPFVAYRQSRRAGEAEEDATDFVQVSPLVEGFCSSEGTSSVFEDPYISFINFPVGDPWEGIRLVYVDRTPYRDDLEFRYQIVFFSHDGEIREYAVSNWIQY